MVEIVWTLSAAVGATAAIYGAVQAWIDLRYLRAEEHDGLRLIGRQRLLAQMFRSIITGGWLLVGLGLISDGIDNIAVTPVIVALIVGNVLTTLIALSDTIVGQIVRNG